MIKLRYVSGLKSKLKALVPRRLKYTLLADCIELLLTRTHFLDGADEPPSLIEYGGGGFVPIGNQLVQLMMARAGLADGMVVVDIGCGIGRMAVAMSKRLRKIRYVGFDVVNYGILWCRKRFSTLPDYRFLRANIFNTFYNPRGSEAASSYRFPASDSTTDFVCATSVFTHMPASEVTHYLRETSRCLKRGAKAYFTVFILDHESRGQIESNLTLFRFQQEHQGAYVETPDEPDLAVAYDKSVFETMVAGAGLEVVAFYPGYWRKLHYEDFQDAYVLAKP
jgi:ubiquinone/menaquinone biosynthesis C-methylase UbiE